MESIHTSSECLYMPGCDPLFVEIVAKVAERHVTASTFHVTIGAQNRYAVRAGNAAQAEYFTDVRTTPQ